MEGRQERDSEEPQRYICGVYALPQAAITYKLGPESITWHGDFQHSSAQVLLTSRVWKSYHFIRSESKAACADTTPLPTAVWPPASLVSPSEMTELHQDPLRSL